MCRYWRTASWSRRRSGVGRLACLHGLDQEHVLDGLRQQYNISHDVRLLTTIARAPAHSPQEHVDILATLGFTEEKFIDLKLKASEVSAAAPLPEDSLA